ncbi:hypothetical protein SESBI_24676 [Sesbania bispinosa]|nr:hypothetical protein SESBI_24676 [Sesbania bispinosa]
MEEKGQTPLLVAAVHSGAARRRTAMELRSCTAVRRTHRGVAGDDATPAETRAAAVRLSGEQWRG